LALAYLALSLAALLAAWQGLPAQADAAIAREAEATRRVMAALVEAALRAAQQESRSTRLDLVRELKATRRALVGDAPPDAEPPASVADRIDAGLSAIQNRLDARLGEAIAGAEAQLIQTNAHLGTVAAAAIPVQQAASTFDRQFMQSGQLQSRFLAITGESMRTMDAWRRTSEAIVPHAGPTAEAVQRGMDGLADTSENVALITERYTKPQSWALQMAKWVGSKAFWFLMTKKATQ
jgi:hypothetical protein